MPSTDERRALVDLLPQFLLRRRRGWTPPAVLQPALPMLELVLLRALALEIDRGASLTADALKQQLFNPYSTIFAFLDLLPPLIEKGLIEQTGDGYSVTERGRLLVRQFEEFTTAYTAERIDLAKPDLQRFVATLESLADRMGRAPEPVAKPHGARVHRLRSLGADRSLVARLDHAIYALWMLRDDAHNAAWRAAGFDGPSFDILSHIWSGAITIPADLNKLHGNQYPDDITRNINVLIAGGYVERDDERLRLTPHGQRTRDAIEAETDRVYFAAWDELAEDDIASLRGTLERVVAGLPT
jgi:DNA-binding MarR family transcriptional regulator